MNFQFFEAVLLSLSILLQGCSSPLPIKQKLKLPITYAPAAVKNTISQCVRSSCKKQSPFSVWVIRSKYLNCKCLLYKLTWPLRIAPEICGAKNPIMFPTELVIPIKVPANLGAISSWLQVTALKLKPLMPKVAQSKTTTRYRWQPTKWSIHKQIAGGINAENGFCFVSKFNWILKNIHELVTTLFHEFILLHCEFSYNFLLTMRSDKKNDSICLLKFKTWNSWNLVFSEQLDI